MSTAGKVAHAGVKLKNKVKKKKAKDKERKKSKLERKMSKKIETMSEKEVKKSSGSEYVLSRKVRIAVVPLSLI